MNGADTSGLWALRHAALTAAGLSQAAIRAHALMQAAMGTGAGASSHGHRRWCKQASRAQALVQAGQQGTGAGESRQACAAVQTASNTHDGCADNVASIRCCDLAVVPAAECGCTVCWLA